MLPRFLADRSGQFGIGVTLMLVPLVAGIGLAVDYGNMTRERSSLQAALDAATIDMAANVMKDFDDSQLTGRGLGVLKANLIGTSTEIASVELVSHGLAQQADGRIHLSAEARVE
jgi:uncharacterized membrane protein